jgi:F0F1-type ATP synthase epsilon subunit
VVDIRPGKVTVLAELAESSFDLDMDAIEAARESAARMMAQGVPPELNREAAISLRRAELATRITQKLRQRSGAVMRILDQEE